MNTLVAEPSGGPALAEAYSSLKIIGPAAAATAQLGDGGWATAEGIGGAVSTVTDLADFVTDPIASMASSVAGFLLDYMPPLPEMLDSIAGDPGAVEAKSTTWANIGTRVADAADDLDAQVRRALQGWTGTAANAYGAYADVLGQSLRAMSGMCAGLSSVMKGASAVVGFVRSIVRDVIADLVGKLISWAAQVAATAGLGASWVVPKAVVAIARYVEKVRSWITRLTRAVTTVTSAINDANQALSGAVPALRRLSDLLQSGPLAGAGGPSLGDALDSATSLSGLVSTGTAGARTTFGDDD